MTTTNCGNRQNEYGIPCELFSGHTGDHRGIDPGAPSAMIRWQNAPAYPTVFRVRATTTWFDDGSFRTRSYLIDTTVGDEKSMVALAAMHGVRTMTNEYRYNDGRIQRSVEYEIEPVS